MNQGTIADYAKLAGDMSAREAAGQLFILGFDGTHYTSGLGSWFRRLRPAGVILFGRNIENAAQTKNLTGDIIKLSEDVTGMAPLVAVDEEGGRVSRLPKDIFNYMEAQGRLPKDAAELRGSDYLFPTAGQMGADGSEERVERVHALIGECVRALGFNLDFAPVADLDTNPDNPVIGDRSFGADPAKTAALCGAAMRGLKSAGVLSCLKHFPGHGDTSADSHLELPSDARPAARFADAELAPYEAVRELADFVMTAHVLYPSMDGEHPATLSRRIIEGMLREKIGYDGVVITDDMDMKAVSTSYGDAEAARLALMAGCDMILSCRDTARQARALDAVERMIDGGAIPEKDVMTKLGRALKAKSAAAAKGS